MAIPISHEECWNRLQRLGVEHQAMKYELDESAAELARLLDDIENIKKILEILSLSGMDDYDIMSIGQAIRIAAESIAKAEVEGE